MTEKPYRLNKWGTKLLKNNRPLFDWANEGDNIVDLLNELHEENKKLKDLLKSMTDRNNEIWLNNGQIIRLKKEFKGEWTND